MGNWIGCFFEKTPPPPMVLVPPMFDFPPLASRTRMLEPAYDLLFGKLVRRCLFEDYFEQPRHFSTRIMLKPIDDPHVDLIATVSYKNMVAGPLDSKTGETLVGNALFRWQRDLEDPHTFMDLFVSNSEQILNLRSCAYYPKCGIGAFGIFPLLKKKRILSDDYGVMGLRYGAEHLSVGVTLLPFPLAKEIPRSAWVVSKIGKLTAGAQYKPDFASKDHTSYNDVKNWSWAIGYGSGSSSPLSPSYNFGLEFAKSSQLIASFYQHVVVQRRVKNPFEENEIVGITNYIDFGFELERRINNGNESSTSVEESTFQVAASWQANKNFLLKGQVGTASSSLALAFKSWWKPSFTFSVSAIRDRLAGKTAFGFGIRIEDLREASYQRADPNYVMLTQTKEHLAEGIIKNIGKRPMLQSDVSLGNFDHLPRELKPIDKIL